MSPNKNNIKAKVFISCGQNKNTDEVEIAQSIAKKLEENGFDYYIAVQEQSLKGVKENIFKQIKTSEYFLFIDFKREKIKQGYFQRAIHRGSLFSHQELALASYLEMPLIAFQENGVKTDDGIMKFIQANCKAFTNRQKLTDLVMQEIEKQWSPNWKNQLCLKISPKYSDAMIPRDVQARFYHIIVKNHHRSKIATNCYAYLESAKQQNNSANIPLKTIELKWAGYILPNAMITPHSTRFFDAFFISHTNPSGLQCNVFADSTEYIPRIQGPGDFEVTYAVVSENFPVARATFKVHIGNKLEDITLT
jgi:hypothetical protein